MSRPDAGTLALAHLEPSIAILAASIGLGRAMACSTVHPADLLHLDRIADRPQPLPLMMPLAMPLLIDSHSKLDSIVGCAIDRNRPGKSGQQLNLTFAPINSGKSFAINYLMHIHFYGNFMKLIKFVLS